MWTLIKSVLLKWAALKLLLKSLGSLGILVPLAFVLKLLGIKTLIILAILALPVLLVLLVLGLPIILVFVIGGMLLGLVGTALSIGIAALKIVIPVVLVVWILRWLFGNGRHPDPAAGDSTA